MALSNESQNSCHSQSFQLNFFTSNFGSLLVLSFVGYLSAGNVGLNLCIEVPTVKLVVEQVALSVVLRWQRTFVSRLPSIGHSVQSRLPLLPLLLSRLPLTWPESLHQAARSFEAVLFHFSSSVFQTVKYPSCKCLLASSMIFVRNP